MDFITIAKQRMSVRDYKETKVEPEKLGQILEAAHVAPTAANLQPIRLIAVQSEEGLAKILHPDRPHDAPGHRAGPWNGVGMLFQARCSAQGI